MHLGWERCSLSIMPGHLFLLYNVFVRSNSDDVIPVLAYICRTQFRGVRIAYIRISIVLYICVTSKCGSIQWLYVERHSHATFSF